VLPSSDACKALFGRTKRKGLGADLGADLGAEGAAAEDAAATVAPAAAAAAAEKSESSSDSTSSSSSSSGKKKKKNGDKKKKKKKEKKEKKKKKKAEKERLKAKEALAKAKSDERAAVVAEKLEIKTRGDNTKLCEATLKKIAPLILMLRNSLSHPATAALADSQRAAAVKLFGQITLVETECRNSSQLSFTAKERLSSNLSSGFPLLFCVISSFKQCATVRCVIQQQLATRSQCIMRGVTTRTCCYVWQLLFYLACMLSGDQLYDRAGPQAVHDLRSDVGPRELYDCLK
jgi:hypothetical protein